LPPEKPQPLGENKSRPRKVRAQLLLDQIDLAHIIYSIRLAPPMEQPGPSTMRKLTRAFERAGGDMSEFER
jgi:hypothetical protein